MQPDTEKMSSGGFRVSSACLPRIIVGPAQEKKDLVMAQTKQDGVAQSVIKYMYGNATAALQTDGSVVPSGKMYIYTVYTYTCTSLCMYVCLYIFIDDTMCMHACK